MIYIVVVVIIILLLVSMYFMLSESSETSYDASKSSDGASKANTTGASTSSAPAAPKYVPFVAGTATSTPWNDVADGMAIYLDRHNMDCGPKALNQILYKRNPADLSQFGMQYTCGEGGALDTPIPKNTPWDEDGNGNTIYLDRHDAVCPENSVMTKLQLARSGNNTWQWQYACAPSKQDLTCRPETTPMDDEGHGHSIYLDRHNIKCNPNEALSRVRLARDPAGGKYQFEYTCCS